MSQQKPKVVANDSANSPDALESQKKLELSVIRKPIYQVRIGQGSCCRCD